MSYSKTLRKKLMNASFGFLAAVTFFFIGQYMYWQVYPVRRIVKVWQSEPFTVIE